MAISNCPPLYKALKYACTEFPKFELLWDTCKKFIDKNTEVETT